MNYQQARDAARVASGENRLRCAAKRARYKERGIVRKTIKGRRLLVDPQTMRPLVPPPPKTPPAPPLTPVVLDEPKVPRLSRDRYKREAQAFAYLRASHRTSVDSGAGLAAQDHDVEDMLRLVAAGAVDAEKLAWSEESYNHDQPGRFCDKVVSAFTRPFFTRPAAIALMDVMRPGV